MATVKEDLGPGAEGGREARQPAPADAQPRAAWWRRAPDSVLGLARRHWIFSIALVVSLVLRVTVMLGYRPAVLFRMDSFDYLWNALHLSPNVINPSGYSLFLWLLEPFHSLVLVTALQHLMGLVIATMVYVILRRYNLPAWGATLAAAPVLFDPAQILAEQFIMADLFATALMVSAFAVLLLRESPSLWRSVTAALLMGASATVRPTALPLVVLIPVYLLIRHAGWRRAAATLAAGALPVLAYAGWFDSAHGSFNLTNSNGLFLWSRTMSFADCAVIKPPADLRPLCPEVQPGRLSRPVPSTRPLPKNYLWNRDTWEWQPPSHQFVPDTAAFTRANNARALRFALRAIASQPLAYAKVVARETVQPLIHTNVLRFPVNNRQDSVILTPGNLRYAYSTVRSYNRSATSVDRIVHHRYGVRLVAPYTDIIGKYQNVIYLPAPLFSLIVIAGLVGILIPRRRTPAAVLLWVSAIIIMVLPTAEHEYTYRYVIPAVPLMCMAAALAFRTPRTASAAGDLPVQAEPAASADGASERLGSSPSQRAAQIRNEPES